MIRRAKRVSGQSCWVSRSVAFVECTTMPWFTDSPIPLPIDGTNHVNNPETERELNALQRSTTKDTPFGDNHWQTQTCLRSVSPSP